MTNKTIPRLLLRDRTRMLFSKYGLFAGLLAALMVLAPLQIMARANGNSEATKRLFKAVYDNNLPAVQVSITDGADIEATDKSGLTPVDIAVDDGFFDIAHFLLSVRNFRENQPSADTGQATPQTPEPAPKAPAPVVKKLSKAATAPALPPIPAWPKGKPNPFDPGAIGAALPVLGKVQGKVLGKVLGKPPPKAVATAPPPEPEPAAAPKPKPEPKASRKISKSLREVAETPPPPPPPPPEVEAAGAPLAVSKRPGEGAKDDAGPSSVERLMDKVSKAMKQEARTGEARTGKQQEARTESETATLKARSLKPNSPPRAPVPRLAPTPGARSENVNTEPPPGIVERTSNFFSSLLSDTSTPPAAKIPKTPKGPKPIKDDGGKWVVRDVETAAKKSPGKSGKQYAEDASRQAAITEGKAPTVSLSRYLTGITLTLGRSVRLGIPQLAQGGAHSEPCIKKKDGVLAFCIEDVDWPDWIKPYFQVNSIMYQGAKAIARYDNGVATSYHVIFPTGSYPAIVQYYTEKFGKPTKTLNRSIAPLAAPRRENPTAIWQSIDTVTKQVATLEVREFDDARGTFPDTRRGAVMLYQQWSSPIFPNLSTLELMILNARQRAK